MRCWKACDHSTALIFLTVIKRSIKSCNFDRWPNCTSDIRSTSHWFWKTTKFDLVISQTSNILYIWFSHFYQVCVLKSFTSLITSESTPPSPELPAPQSRDYLYMYVIRFPWKTIMSRHSDLLTLQIMKCVQHVFILYKIVMNSLRSKM